MNACSTYSFTPTQTLHFSALFFLISYNVKKYELHSKSYQPQYIKYRGFIPDKAHPIVFIFIVISIMRKWDFSSYSPEEEHVCQETFVFITWLTI